MAASGTSQPRPEDKLSLAVEPAVQKFLKADEKVVHSDTVIKFNKKDKQQSRNLLITNQAVYNLDKKKMKRRIGLDFVFGVTMSSSSDQFVIHVSEEYDYRYKSSDKANIVAVLKQQKAERKDPLSIKVVDNNDLKDNALTKSQARNMTREQLYLRKKELTAKTHESDGEEAQEGKDKAGEIEQLMPGERVGVQDFELMKVLGRGAFGKVMQVRKKDTGVVYAMKILKKRHIIMRNQVEHTRAERDILMQLQHPFLMNLRFAFQSSEKLYLVLDYYNGGELFFHLKKKRRFAEADARIYVAEIGLALGHLHSKGVIYRDLKPENILMDDRGHVCLTDFGLAKRLDPEDTTSTFCGTPEYLAPEIVKGLGHDKAVDWWSLGILLYELTVGIPPFYSQNVNEMYNKIQHGVLRFPPFLSESCRSLITMLLNRNPASRLCSGATDVEELKSHAFYANMDWDALMAKEVAPSFVPDTKGNADTSFFDEVFTSEQVVDSVVPDSELAGAKAGAEFQGFTFAPKQGMIPE